MADEDGFSGPRRHDEAGLGRLLNKLRSLERDVAELKRGAALRGAGIRVSPEGMTVNSSLDVQGSLSASGDTEIGGTLDVTGDATIGGPTGLKWTDAEGRVRFRLGRSAGTTGTGADLNNFVYRDASGTGRAWIGQIAEAAGDFEMLGHGLLVQDASGEDMLGVWDDHALMRSGQDMYLLAGENVLLQSNNGTIGITAEGGDALVTGDVVGFRSPNGSGGWAVDVHSIGAKFNAVADNGFTVGTPNNSHRIQVVGSDIGVDAPNRLYVAADLHATGDLSCAGTKPFIIDHPTNPDLSLVHVATESDQAVVEYHYRATIGDDGSATIDLPDYFEGLTAPDSRGVQVTPVGRPFMVGAEEPAGGQVIVYGDPGRDVFVRINARRGDDAGQFEAEIPRIQPPANTEEGKS